MSSLFTIFVKRQVKLITFLTILIITSLSLASYTSYINSIKRYNDVVTSLNSIFSYYLTEEEKRVSKIIDKLKKYHLSLAKILAVKDINNKTLIKEFKAKLTKELDNNIDIALINRDLIITNTTLPAEKNFNLKQFEDARIVASEVLSKDDENYVNITFPVYTPATNTFRIYTFSYIKKLNIFLQIGMDTTFLKVPPLINLHDKNITANIYYSGGSKSRIDTFDLKKKVEVSLPETFKSFLISPESELILDSFMFKKYYYKAKKYNFLKNMFGSIVIEVFLNKKSIYINILKLFAIEIFILLIIYITFLKNISSYKKLFLKPFRKMLTNIKKGQPIENNIHIEIRELLILAKTYNDIINKLNHKNRELEKALLEIKTLRNLLPVCSRCKKIRNKNGEWEDMEKYLSKKHQIDFTHGLCPECLKIIYPEYADNILKKIKKNKKQ